MSIGNIQRQLSSPTHPRFFVPEVVQVSATDCGPATLKSLLAGFGIPVSYERLREACQTSLDGSSIDTIEDVANLLGLNAVQLLVPVEHALLPQAAALPGIVVTRLPDGGTHFVLLWRRHGGLVQVMDPAVGRRWLTHRRLQQEMYLHAMHFPATVWRDWAGSDAFCLPLRARLEGLGMTSQRAEELLALALADASWRSLAGLDAVIRQAQSLVDAGGVRQGKEAAGLADAQFTRLAAQNANEQPVVGWAYWRVRPLLAAANDTDDLTLEVQGVVLLHISGVRTGAQDSAAPDQQTAMPAALATALGEQTISPLQEVWRLLKVDGLLTPGLIAAALLIAGAAVTVQALFLRGITELWRLPLLGEQRLLIVLGLLGLTGLLVGVELPVMASISRMGRRLESRLRMAFLEKLPRINDHYFRSRLVSDMARRAHNIQSLRDLPALGFALIRNGALLLGTAIGLIWLDPASALLLLLGLTVLLGIILVAQPVQAELDLRVQSHASGLSRYFLDVLRGLLPVRSHSAGRAIRREHEAKLTEFHRASRTTNRFALTEDAILSLLNTALAIGIVFFYISRGREAAGVLILLYWALNIPQLVQRIAALAREYPRQRNHLMRLLEPLVAAEDEGMTGGQNDPATGEAPTNTRHPRDHTSAPVALHFAAVRVVAGGHTVLDGVELTVAPGEHVAIVGRSGAGKSSLVGLLLGWRTLEAGQVLVDGAPVSGKELQALRRSTVWVDPEVQIWNRSLLENLRYGQEVGDGLAVGPVLQQADLTDVLRSLPAGMQTRLGEGGGLVSGGEGQRVRLGRGLMHPAPRLVILDEPFRGLDRTQRHELLARARRQWQNVTLLCVTHDLSAVLNFDRVVVMEGGRIVEEGAPGELAGQPDSHFRRMLEEEVRVRRDFWQAPGWRRLWLADGKLPRQPM